MVLSNHVLKGSFCGRVPDVYFGTKMSCNFRIIERIVRTGKILLNWNRCMIRSGHCFKFCLNYCETALIRIPTGQTRPRKGIRVPLDSRNSLNFQQKMDGPKTSADASKTPKWSVQNFPTLTHNRPMSHWQWPSMNPSLGRSIWPIGPGFDHASG